MPKLTTVIKIPSENNLNLVALPLTLAKAEWGYGELLDLVRENEFEFSSYAQDAQIIKTAYPNPLIPEVIQHLTSVKELYPKVELNELVIIFLENNPGGQSGGVLNYLYFKLEGETGEWKQCSWDTAKEGVRLRCLIAIHNPL